MSTTITPVLISTLLLFSTWAHAAESHASPHPVPWEFSSDRYNVTVNGQPATVFFAAMNLHFASFDFTGEVDVQITIRDCDVIHMGRSSSQWMGADWALFTTVIPHGTGVCEHLNYLLEDIRCEESAALLGVNWPQATLRNFRFKNIQIADGADKSFLRGSADGITFDNVRIAGRPATNTADINLTIQGDARNIRFEKSP